MAVDLCSEISGVATSPRISFSHDLSHSEIVPVEHLIRSTSSSSVDFDFSVVRVSSEHESSSADELFLNGRILPTQIKKKAAPPLPSLIPQSEATPPPARANQDSREIMADFVEKQSSKPFWRIKRSRSLNCASGYAPSLCPLPLLSRSNSTGSSSPTFRRSSLHKSPPFAASAKQTQSCSSHPKPPLKKNVYGSYGNNGGARVNPVLNVPTANLFGLGSIFYGGKDKSKKK